MRSFACMVLCLSMVLWAGAGFVHAAEVAPGTVGLGWDAPDKNEDGTPLLDLAGYKVYHSSIPPSPIAEGKTERRASEWVDAISEDIGLPATTQHSMTNIPTGLHFFGMTAYDAWGNESVLSGIVSLDVPLHVDRMPPRAPGGIVCDAHFPVGAGQRPFLSNCRSEQPAQ